MKTILEQVQKLKTDKLTIEEIAYRLDASKNTIHKYLYLLNKNFKRHTHRDYPFICVHCGRAGYGGRATKYCQRKECQAVKERTYRDPKNKKKCPQCKKYRNKDDFATNLCLICVRYNDSHFGDGWVSEDFEPLWATEVSYERLD